MGPTPDPRHSEDQRKFLPLLLFPHAQHPVGNQQPCLLPVQHFFKVRTVLRGFIGDERGVSAMSAVFQPFLPSSRPHSLAGNVSNHGCKAFLPLFIPPSYPLELQKYTQKANLSQVLLASCMHLGNQLKIPPVQRAL
jgi:hypothetical protein